jgi:hypothetical protein
LPAAAVVAVDTLVAVAVVVPAVVRELLVMHILPVLVAVVPAVDQEQPEPMVVPA